MAELFDERDLAVKQMIIRLIKTAHKQGCKVGICGQAPSAHPDFTTFLIKAGIDSISLNLDSARGEATSSADEREVREKAGS